MTYEVFNTIWTFHISIKILLKPTQRCEGMPKVQRWIQDVLLVEMILETLELV